MRFMSESAEQFYGRAYMTLDRAFVYPKLMGKGNPEIWTLEQARQYANYLERNERATQ